MSAASTRRSHLSSAAVALTASLLPLAAVAKSPPLSIEEAREIGERKREAEEAAKGPLLRSSKGVRYREPVKGPSDAPLCEKGDTCKVKYQVYKGNGDYVFSLGYGREFKQDRLDTYAIKYGDPDKKIPLAVEDAMSGMRVGSLRKILVPPELGFNTSNQRPEPDTFSGKRKLAVHINEPLLFEVELVKVNKKGRPADE